MACRLDIRKKILDKVNEVFIEGRYTYYRVNDGTFRVANVRETKGKSRAKSLDQAREIATEVKDRIVAKYGNNVFVEVILPQYVGFPVEIKVTPSELYVEKLFAKVLAEKRTEPISRLIFLQDPALYQQELMEDSPLKMIPYEAWLAQNKALNPIVDEKGQIKFFQRANVAETLNTLAKSPEKIENLKRTTEYSLLEQQDEDLRTKSGQAYIFLKEKDATRFSFLLEKHKQFPKEFTVTQKVTKYERDKVNPLNFIGYNEYRDFLYVKSNNNKKSNLYNIIDTSTGELIAEKVRVLHLTKDAKEGIAKKYGLEFTPTEVFSPDRSIAFALYRQKPSKAKYIAQSKKYLYDALKFLNPEETGLKINLNQIGTLLDSFPSGMWDYINTTYSPEDSTNINASISLQNEIKFKLPKLGLLTEIEKITGKKLQGVSFTNYDRSGGIQKVLRVDWGDTVTIDYKSMTTKQLRKAIAYYLNSTGYFKPSSEEENVRKYAEHRGIDYNELKELVFGDFDKALDNIAYNQTGNSNTIELSKWRDSIRNYDWQIAELFSKPYEDFYKRAKEKVTEKFKDKKLSNGISHLDYFFSGNFNWLNINFNNISGQYYEEDMETQANVGVAQKVVGKINPFVMNIYKKPTPGKNFLKEQEVFNRLASILHEPFHALHALSYGTPEELELRKAFNNLYNTKFGKEMMNQVFGSGYRGEQISFDTLYKEFTAFATQLMLFPKEWIRKTDLRSNDIFEFIEKVQTLQDKTYEEIVRTKQKIGTTERIDTVEEKIKLTFLEKLYNFIASALNKVIPLSKKFFKTIADSKLVENNIIEDVFGEVEETVTKVVKLPKDIEASKEEFLTKMDELKSAIMTLMQIDETMFSPKNIDNFFSQPAFYQETAPNPIVDEKGQIKLFAVKSEIVTDSNLHPLTAEEFSALQRKITNEIVQSKFKDYKSVKELLTDIATNTKKDSYNNILATFLLNVKGVNDTILEVNVDFEKGYYGDYQGILRRIRLSKELNSNKSLFETTALHEILHSVTVNVYDQQKTFKKEIDDIYNYVKSVSTSEQLSMYGMKNSYEFMAEAFTNTTFIKFLESIPAEKELGLNKNKISKINIFEKFIQTVINYLAKFEFFGTKNRSFNTQSVAEAVRVSVLNNAKQIRGYENKILKSAEQNVGYIKPGVQELFESNQSLANAVYESLGFNKQGEVQRLTDMKILANWINKQKTLRKGLSDRDDGLKGVSIYIRDSFKEIPKNIQNLLKENLTTTFDRETGQNWNWLNKEDYPRTGTLLDFFDNLDALEDFVKENELEIIPQQKQKALQQYSQYLDTVFPDSKVKDIVYHGSTSKEKFENFKLKYGNDESFQGFYFADTKFQSEGIAGKEGRVFPVLLNANPKLGEFGITATKEDINQAKIEGYNSLREEDELRGKNFNTTIVFEPEQIHILGNKQDIEGFKQFAQTTPITPTTTDITEIPDVMAAMIYQNNNCK